MKDTETQKADQAGDTGINQLIVSASLAAASLKEYREEDRTYRVDAKAMIDLISSLESISTDVERRSPLP